MFHNYPCVSQSLAKILLHTVFSTKDRRPFLRDTAVREELGTFAARVSQLELAATRSVSPGVLSERTEGH